MTKQEAHDFNRGSITVALLGKHSVSRFDCLGLMSIGDGT